MGISIWKNLIKYGYLSLPYTTIQSLGILNAIVLMQILAEYNRAVRDKLNIGTCFLADFGRMSDYLNLDKNDLEETVVELHKLGLIHLFSSFIENTYVIRVQEDKIVKYIETFEQENQSDNWDCGLARTQNPINKKTNFSELTIQIKNKVDNFFNKINYLPIISYVYINDYIHKHEEKWNKLVDEIDLDSQITNILKTSKDLKYDLTEFIEDLYYKHIKEH